MAQDGNIAVVEEEKQYRGAKDNAYNNSTGTVEGHLTRRAY